MTIISLKKAHKHFDGIDILNNFHVDIGPKSLVVLTGPSGSGKSTLLNIFGLLDSLNSGQYYLFDRDTQSLTSKQKSKLRKDYFGYVFQDHLLIPEWTVEENIFLATRYQDKPMDPHHYDFLINKLNISSILNQRTHTLSGGQQQRVSMARSLLMKPKIIIADEPTSSLDSENENQVKQLLSALTYDLGHTLILATHDLTWVPLASIHIDLNEVQE